MEDLYQWILIIYGGKEEITKEKENTTTREAKAKTSIRIKDIIKDSIKAIKEIITKKDIIRIKEKIIYLGSKRYGLSKGEKDQGNYSKLKGKGELERLRLLV